MKRTRFGQLKRWLVSCLLLVVAAGLLAGCTKRDKPSPMVKKPAVKQPDKKQSPAKAGKQPRTAYAALSKADQERAKLLYGQHCAGCHGEQGDGLALAARYVFPKPRDFRAGRFRLVSTTNGVPTIKDIEAVLVRGMPGSAMPPWPALKEADRKLLAEQVIEFRREGIRAIQIAMAAELDEEISEPELSRFVEKLTTPGTAVEVPPLGDATTEAIERGKQLYLTKGCASCHGKDGRGDGQEKMVDAEGLPTRPRDLTKGIFKGSPDVESVYRRTQAGMPGTPMPATTQMTHEQITKIVHFVRSLSDEQTRAATVLNREKILAGFVETAPEFPDDAIWNNVKPVRVRLAPLWWRDVFTPHLDVQAVYDGKVISLRLSWPDNQADTHAAKTEAFEDAVAVELYRGDAEPFLGMGATNSPVDVWMWDADRQTGAPDVEDVNPNIVVDRYPNTEKVVDTAEYKRPGTKTAAQAAINLPAQTTGNQISPRPALSAATSLETSGPGTVTFRPPVNQLVKATGVWKDGHWIVVMTRPLSVENLPSSLSLKPGDRASIAFAVWDGAQRDRNGKKSITIWQDLVLEKPGG